jgi:hypothetical protein
LNKSGVQPWVSERHDAFEADVKVLLGLLRSQPADLLGGSQFL